MRKQSAWATAALAVAIVAGISTSADAFHCHRYLVWSFPGGNAYYGCAASYQACVVGYGACGPVGCGYGGCVGYNCGYYNPGRCGSCGNGSGHYGCVARHCAAHRYRKYYGRGYCGFSNCYGGCGWSCLGGSCGYGDCGNGGCGGGGCESGNCVSAPSGGAAGMPSDANIISDRTIGDDPAPAPALDQSAGINRSVFRLTGLKQDDAAGAPAFERGLSAYRNGSKNDALESFSMAAEAEPTNAMYLYYRALAMFDVSGAEGAGDMLAEAIDVEKREGVKNWGKRMERVQGRSRLWVEKARRDAGLVR